jgi:hypothetical protein
MSLNSEEINYCSAAYRLGFDNINCRIEKYSFEMKQNISIEVTKKVKMLKFWILKTIKLTRNLENFNLDF